MESLGADRQSGMYAGGHHSGLFTGRRFCSYHGTDGPDAAFSWISSMGALFLVCELDQNQRVMEERQLWKMRSLYYKNLEKEQLQIRRMKHDMQNHLYTLQGLPAEKKEAYLDDLLGALSVQRAEHFSDNPVVQTVLAKKQVRWRRQRLSERQM